MFSFGADLFHGSLPGERIVPVAPIVGIAPIGGYGYWLVGSDGGVFSIDACSFTGSFLGSMAGHHLNAPIVGIASSGDGYWLAGADGGVFSFGAPFYGSLPAMRIRPSAPIVGIAPTPDEGGYWLVGADGGVFS
ncbi:MAG: hypothetical protein ACRD6W_04265, partial [Nitrososphaerales archaeon]